MRRLALSALGVVIALAVSRPAIEAQVRPVYDRGAAGLTQLLERLTTTASALHTGAHPDDEDSAFLARTARGDHARVAYLALNRGEGGQNIIGRELFDALGVIRTEELLQARRLDGAEQFFTRAFDFGFSKTRAETAALWNEQAVLEDMVRVIRTFRPLVIYSRFSGTAADGHGHHQEAGYLTPIAFKAAGDASAFPDLARSGLRPWQARKLYTGAGRGGGTGPMLQVATGNVDPAIGRSYAEIAAEGRSQHKSQEMGTIEPLGPSSSQLRLVDSLVTAAATESSIFDGIDVTIPGLARLAGLPAGALQRELAAIDSAAQDALRTYQPLQPATLLPTLANGLQASRNARAALRNLTASRDAVADAEFLLARKEEEFTAALLRAADVLVDPLAAQETVEPGGALEVTVRVFAANPSVVRITGTSLVAPPGWTVTAEQPRDGAGGIRRETATASSSHRVQVPRDAPLTAPYFLQTPRTGPMYQWPESQLIGVPFDPPLLTGTVALEIAGVTITASAPVVYRYADSVRGELRRNVNVAPAVALGFDSTLMIVPASGPGRTQRVQVHVSSLRAQPVAGTLSLTLPAGWTATPSSTPFTLNASGDRTGASFTITPPPTRATGRYEVTARATVDGATYSRDVQVVAYPHIQTHRLYSPAAVTARVVDVAVAPVKVGYIMGSGDEVPEALRRLNVSVTMLDDEALAMHDLNAYDTIVVGIRASEARPAFVANHGRLRQFMERGGTLIVQYQQGEYVAKNLPPYPVQMAGNSRVTDETAPVKVLAPTHAALTYPNRITSADFDGWVQERNLYAFSSFDPRYVPLLESADPGEMPQRGGEVYAQVGRGHYVYTAYSWFRQLPAGVPGAYRMFANLISLSKAPARAGSPAPDAVQRTREVPLEAPDRTRPSR